MISRELWLPTNTHNQTVEIWQSDPLGSKWSIVISLTVVLKYNELFIVFIMFVICKGFFVGFPLPEGIKRWSTHHMVPLWVQLQWWSLVLEFIAPFIGDKAKESCLWTWPQKAFAISSLWFHSYLFIEVLYLCTSVTASYRLITRGHLCLCLNYLLPCCDWVALLMALLKQQIICTKPLQDYLC